MAVGTGTALLGSAAIGAGSSLLGNKQAKKNAGGQPIDPYTFFPEVKEAYKETVLPRAAEEFNQPYPAMPMARAVDPASDPFASRALYDLQMARDAEIMSQPMAAPQVQQPPAMPQRQEEMEPIFPFVDPSQRREIEAYRKRQQGPGQTPVTQSALDGLRAELMAAMGK